MPPLRRNRDPRGAKEIDAPPTEQGVPLGVPDDEMEKLLNSYDEASDYGSNASASKEQFNYLNDCGYELGEIPKGISRDGAQQMIAARADLLKAFRAAHAKGESPAGRTQPAPSC